MPGIAARPKSMFTICPKCALTLLVTAEDLRVAQGYVRCGRCSSVFNALARLTEEEQPPEPAPGTAPQTRRQRSREEPAEEGGGETPPPETSAGESAEAGAHAPPSPAPDTSDEDSIPEDALEFDPRRTDVTKVFVEPAPSPQWSAATGTFKAMRAANQEAMQLAEEDARPSPPEPSAHIEEPEPHTQPPRAPLPQASAADDDVDIDVEIGPEQLASILRGDLAPVPPAAPSSLTGARAAPAPSEPKAASEPKPAAEPKRASEPKPPAEPKRAASAPSAPSPPGGAAAVAPPSTPPAPPPRSRSVSATVRALRDEVSAPPAPSSAPAASPPPAASSPPESPRELPDAAFGSADESSRPYARVLRIMQPHVAERLKPYAWGAGAVVMVLVLLGQIVNHHRDEIAANARFGRPLIELYSALGVRLTPHWDVKAYDVRQLGASVEPGGAGLITVRASVKNGAPQAQPLPLLRVTLQDRFGNRIAARDVAPRFYLSRNAPAFLSAGERIDAEMGFVDPGANAVGFEIDACLPTSGGVITCANDITAR